VGLRQPTSAGSPVAHAGFAAPWRGGKYRNTPADTQVPYLKTVLAFLGMTDVQIVYAEGLAMGPDAERQALASARTQIEEVLAA
jgi:FMN-dependent NADH-azoreductase